MAFNVCMIDLLWTFHKKDHAIWLNKEFLLDFQWGDHLLPLGNAIRFWLYPGISPAVELEVLLDAVGLLGFGACLQGCWFLETWSKSQVSQSIEYKEIIPIAIAARLWGSGWSKQHVLFCSDKDTVVHILNSRTSRTRRYATPAPFDASCCM